MRKFILFFMMVLIVNSCGDDNNITSPDNNHIVQGSIKGVILNKITNEPIDGAFITTLPLTSTTKSNAEGKFELPSVSPDLYNIIITHPDYKTYDEKIKVGDQITNDLEFILTSYTDLNTPPNKPQLIYPVESKKLGFKDFLFTWNATDSDNDTLTFDLYFGVKGQPFTKIASNLKEMSFKFQYDFKEELTYNWFVSAKDLYADSQSDTVNFTYKEIKIEDATDLVTLLKLDGDATDDSKNQYESIVENVQFVKDRFNIPNGAAYFNGNPNIKSKIILPVDLQLRNRFSISLWINPDSTLGENGNVGYYEFVSKWGNAGTNLSSFAFGITKDANLFLSTYNSSASLAFANSVKVKMGDWQNVTITFNNGVAKFYLNAVLVKEATAMQIPQESNYQTSIGARQNQLSSYHGSLDDIYIFTKVLNEDEILQLSNQ